MSPWFFMGLVTLGGALAWMLTAYLPRKRLASSLSRPLPPAWLALLEQQALYRKLPAELQFELQGKLKAFLHEKAFIGCDGLVVTDEMRVTIAAQACLLLLNRPTNGYPELRWIYLFPGEFRSRIPRRDEHGIVHLPDATLAGESWENGRVVLAWDSVRRGVARDDDGYNVVLHEFAHQLDQESGAADGAPLLYRREDYDAWSKVFGAAYARLCAAVDAGEKTVIDPYGATSPAEFFAVVTELFYERPAALRAEHPALYDAMVHYFRIDPAEASNYAIP
jgi:Mlc titration factor MtfA (ptsG expression regulator)